MTTPPTDAELDALLAGIECVSTNAPLQSYLDQFGLDLTATAALIAQLRSDLSLSKFQHFASQEALRLTEVESDSLRTRLQQVEGERDEWLQWADGLTGNKHYLSSKMRREIKQKMESK